MKIVTFRDTYILNKRNEKKKKVTENIQNINIKSPQKS